MMIQAICKFILWMVSTNDRTNDIQ